jgi:hypothetical protein
VTPTAVIDDAYCSSAYLALRWVPRRDRRWSRATTPVFPECPGGQRHQVLTADDVLRELRRIVRDSCARQKAGLLLSGGIDSAVLAALAPRGTPAFTIRFASETVADESQRASAYAALAHHPHHVVTVDWADYETSLSELMRHKGAPLHAVEVGLYCAARRAADQGIDVLITGNGADSTFGGLDQLLGRDWTFDAFVDRYTFLPPAVALREPVDLSGVFEPFRREGGIDVQGFLKTVHGDGVTQAFTSAISYGGCATVAPYEDLVLGTLLDLARIRAGESKYILREVFQRLYPGLPLPQKIAFARPMDAWMGDWTGPSSDRFRSEIDVRRMTGEQRWLVFCLDEFLRQRD